MRLLICPDSFKGSATSLEVAHAIRRGLEAVIPPDDELVVVPIADGGEGSLEALSTILDGRLEQLTVKNAVQHEQEAYIFMMDEIAYVELAQASGLPQLAPSERDPLITTTLGTGELIAYAFDRGAKRIVLCIGGSATNDAGTGIAHALGVEFRNAQGELFLPTGATLEEIKSITVPADPVWQGKEIIVLCDVTNPFTGPNGAVATFAPQKGADAQAMHRLESGMLHYSAMLQSTTGIQVRDLPGAGAAGGVGGGLHALLGASLVPGFHYLADAMGLIPEMQRADLVITGEGKLDHQSPQGKVVGGVVSLAQEVSVPVVAICGSLDLNREAIIAMGLRAAFSIQPGVRTWETAQASVISDLELQSAMVARLLNLAET